MITVITPNKEYQIENIGKITILNYKATNETIENTLLFGADMIFKFTPFDNFGTNGDTVTFVQTVADDFSYAIEENGPRIYTWYKNKTQDFYLRNYKDDGTELKIKDVPLNYSIDQFVNTSITQPNNYDYRYPEIRTDEITSLSNQEKKVDYILQQIKAGKISLKELNLEELSKREYNDPKKKKEELIRRLNCDDNVVPCVTYSSLKSAGVWQPGRMSDSPLTKTLNTAKDISGSQHFETMLMYNKKRENQLYALCTVYWGWEIDEQRHSKIFDIECKDGLPEHWEKARELWNKTETTNHGFRIPDIEIWH